VFGRVQYDVKEVIKPGDRYLLSPIRHTKILDLSCIRIAKVAIGEELETIVIRGHKYFRQ